MSIVALFTLDERILRGARGATSESLQATDDAMLDGFDDKPLGKDILLEDVVVDKNTVFSVKSDAVVSTAPALLSDIPVLYWISRSLRAGGMVDTLSKLNPQLTADPSVHAFYLNSLSQGNRFRHIQQYQELFSEFSINADLIKKSTIQKKGELINLLYGQFGYYFLNICSVSRGKSMTLGIRTEPEASYLFDSTLGLLKSDSPGDLGSLLGSWLEHDISPWRNAHYHLWRVTL